MEASIDPPNQWSTAQVIRQAEQVPTIPLWKNGQRVDASAEVSALLQADGWKTEEQDISKLSRELKVWCDALGLAALRFADEVERDQLVNTAEHGGLHAVELAFRRVGAVYQELYGAAAGSFRYEVKNVPKEEA